MLFWDLKKHKNHQFFLKKVIFLSIFLHALFIASLIIIDFICSKKYKTMSIIVNSNINSEKKIAKIGINFSKTSNIKNINNNNINKISSSITNDISNNNINNNIEHSSEQNQILEPQKDKAIENNKSKTKSKDNKEKAKEKIINKIEIIPPKKEINYTKISRKSNEIDNEIKRQDSERKIKSEEIKLVKKEEEKKIIKQETKKEIEKKDIKNIKPSNSENKQENINNINNNIVNINEDLVINNSAINNNENIIYDNKLQDWEIYMVKDISNKLKIPHGFDNHEALIITLTVNNTGVVGIDEVEGCKIPAIRAAIISFLKSYAYPKGMFGTKRKLVIK